jgi:hypothetical protein
VGVISHRRTDLTLRWIAFGGLAVVAILQIGIAHGRSLEARERRLPVFLSDICSGVDVGEYLYLRQPQLVVDAIYRAEGVPSHGNVLLARQYGGHAKVPIARGRAETAALLRRYYGLWVKRGRPGFFLSWVAERYAPIGAANDPTNLNENWLPNVLEVLGQSQGDR